MLKTRLFCLHAFFHCTGRTCATHKVASQFSSKRNLSLFSEARFVHAVGCTKEHFTGTSGLIRMYFCFTYNASFCFFFKKCCVFFNGTSAKIMPAKISRQPMMALYESLSFAQRKAVPAAKTGSIAKIRATLVGVVNFWNLVCAKNASAVAKIDVIIRADTTLPCKITSGLIACLQSSVKNADTMDKQATVEI